MHQSMVVAAALLIVSTSPHAQDQTRPALSIVKRDRVDFSGRWEVSEPGRPAVLGKTFTAAQDGTRLTLETQVLNTSNRSGATVTTPGEPLRRTYMFNGVETRETFPAPARFSQLDPNRVVSSYLSESSSRAAWQGDLLLIVIHNREHVNYPKRTPSEFDTQQTVRLSLSLDDKGILTVERVIISDPDFDSNLRMVLPGVAKTTYKKAS